MEKINGEKIYQGFIAGANAVIKQRKELNRINVFPVADGDTGSNLAVTMYSIIEDSRADKNVKKTMESIADAALVGARGNSGIIFAQYINGLYIEIEEAEDISIESFSKTAKSAVDYAYKAISNPVEGTMITVIREWADYLVSVKDKVNDFGELFTRSLSVANKSLDETPDKLKILRDSKVVDSGAKGFVHFLEGFLDFMNGYHKEEKETIGLGDNMDARSSGYEIPYRYCTEALLVGENLDIDTIRNKLEKLGDSLVIGGNFNKIKIHIHTNNPSEVFYQLKVYGDILNQKADDMQRQYEVLHNRKYDICLITDSIADLPQEIIDRYQIHQIPLNLIVGNNNYLDKLTIIPEYFYEMMETDSIEEYPSSSQPNVRYVEKYLENIIDKYKKIIIISVSSQMSGTINSMYQAINNLNIEEDKYVLIDSKLNSGAQGLLVKKVAEDIDSKKSFEEIVENIDLYIKSLKIYVSVKDLKYMIKSGRIGKVPGNIINKMNFKPVVSIDENGKGSIIGKAFNVGANEKKIFSLVEEENRKNKVINYCIIHANDLERAKEFEKKIFKIINKKPDYIMDISTIVAMSAGIGSVGVAIFTEKG